MSVGTLFIIATPIGNLEDITLRALRILAEVPIIAAEDTRSAQHLLHAHGLWPFPSSKKLISYFEGNEALRTEQLLESLQQGNDIALISEAGLPGISDPGHRLIQAATMAKLPVRVIPGPCAATSALVASGLPTERFLFLGFPPRHTQSRYRLFASVANDPATLIFYESPHRLLSTLEELKVALGENRNAFAGRELTKKYEEYIYGTLEEIFQKFNQQSPRGEFTLVIEGAPQAQEVNEDIEEQIKSMLAKGGSPKDIALALALKLGKPKRQLYQLALRMKEKDLS